MLNFAWSLQNDSLKTVLMVVYNESAEGAGRIFSIYGWVISSGTMSKNSH